MGLIGLWPMPCLGLSILDENGIYIRSRVLDRERSQMMRDEVVRLSKALTAAPRFDATKGAQLPISCRAWKRTIG